MKSKAKTLSARDAASFGQLLQRWDNGEAPPADASDDGAEVAVDPQPASQDDAAGQKAGSASFQPAEAANDGQAKPKATRHGRPEKAAAFDDTDTRAQTDAQPSADTTAVDADAAEPEPVRAALPEAPRASGIRRDEVRLESDQVAEDDQATDETAKASQDDGPATKDTKKAGDAKQKAVADNLTTPAKEATASTLAANTLADLAAAAAPAVQQRAADGTKTQGEDAKQSSSNGQAADGAASGTGSADGDAPTNRIQVSVTRRETHFAPVLNFDQQRAAKGEASREAAAGTQATGTTQKAAAREFAATEAAVKAEAETNVRGTTGEAATSATTTGTTGMTGLNGTTSGFGSITSLPMATAAQVSRAITEEAARMQSGQPAGPNTTTQGPVRILEMAVTPESLGRVVIHMRLTANGLEVRVRASEAATAQMLAQDQNALVRIIEASGTKVDNLDIVRNISSPVEASVRPAWNTNQPSSGSSADQDSPGQREQGRNEGNSRRDQAGEDAQSRSRHSSDFADG
ncbi:flagellar hook-length control protein FliK [Xanthobacter variabilis]|uniref:flagellar hook-length control protein FliK n=1 Tax=Xanthobacter variabilis TaxID=3119932 RepID=UPI00374FC1CD